MSWDKNDYKVCARASTILFLNESDLGGEKQIYIHVRYMSFACSWLNIITVTIWPGCYTFKCLQKCILSSYKVDYSYQYNEDNGVE